MRCVRFDIEHIIFAADSCEYYCLQKSVWECESYSHRGAGHCSDLGEYGGGSGVL